MMTNPSIKTLDATLKPNKIDKLHNWARKSEESLKLRGIFVGNLGKMCNFPLSLDDLEVLCKFAKSSSHHTAVEDKSPCVIASDAVHLISSNMDVFYNTLTTQIMNEMFQIRYEQIAIDVKIIFENLVICRPGQLYCGNYNQVKMKGEFGSLILFLPLQNHYSGGVLQILHNNEVVAHEFLLDNQQSHFLASMAGERSTHAIQHYKVQACENTPVVFLVFSLVWSDAIDLSNFIPSDRFPSFVTSVAETHKALSFWIPPVEDIEINTSSELSKEFTCLDFLCYSLSKNYSLNSFNLSNLIEEDLYSLHVFKAIPYIDVCLGIIIKNDYDEKNSNCCCCFTKKVVTLKEDKRYTSLVFWDLFYKSGTKFDHLDVKNRVVGPLESCLVLDKTSEQIIPESFTGGKCKVHKHRHSCTCGRGGNVDGSSRSLHPVLVIQPKWFVYSEPPHLRFQPALRDLHFRSLEAQRKMAGGSWKMRSQVLSDIRKLFVYAFHPVAQIDTTNCCEVFNVRTLLNYCIRLKAPEEGLQVLSFIADKRCPCGNHDFSLEIKTDTRNSLLNDVADFIICVAGWDACSSAIRRVIINHKLGNEFIDLVTNLLNRNCPEEAVKTADILNEKLINMTKEPTATFPRKFLAKLAIVLNRMKATVNLDVEQRYTVIKHWIGKFKPNGFWSELEELVPYIPQQEPIRELFEELAGILSNADMKSFEERNYICLISAIKRCRNFKLSERLWVKVCDNLDQHSPSSKKNEANNLPYLHGMIMSIKCNSERIALIESLSFSPSVAELVLDKLVDVCFRIYMMSKVPKNYAPYFIIVCLAESNPSLAKERRFEAFCSHFKTIGVPNLWITALNVYLTDKIHLKERRSSCIMYKRLLDELLNRNLFEVMKSAGNKYPDVLRCLLWFDDNELNQKFIVRIVETRQVALSYESAKVFIEMVPKILSSPGIFGELMEVGTGKIDRMCFSILLDTWLNLALLVILSESDFIESNSFVPDIFLAYVKAEKYLAPEGESAIHPLFPMLIEKVSFDVLSRVAVRIYKYEMESGSPSLKHFASCRNNFRIALDFLSFQMDITEEMDNTNLEDFVLVIECYFWFDDNHLLNVICRKVTSVTTVDSRLLHFKCKVVKSPNILQFGLKSQSAFEHFIMLLDDCEREVQEKAKPAATLWTMRNVNTLFIRPEVQTFLEQNRERAVIGRFETIESAEKFARDYIDTEWGIRHTIVRRDDGKFDCELTKTRPHLIITREAKTWMAELTLIRDVRKKLIIERENYLKKTESNGSLVSVDIILPPSKHCPPRLTQGLVKIFKAVLILVFVLLLFC